MKICTLCPRMCAVDRKSGERGICGQTTEIKVARSFFPAVHCTVCSARMKILQMARLVR